MYSPFRLAIGQRRSSRREKHPALAVAARARGPRFRDDDRARGGSALTVPDVEIATEYIAPLLRYVTSRPLRPHESGPPAPSVVNCNFEVAGPSAIFSGSNAQSHTFIGRVSSEVNATKRLS